MIMKIILRLLSVAQDTASFLFLEVIIFIGRFISFISNLFNVGSGGTWPGEIALKFDPNILTKIAPKNIILVAGTNGKTTTTLMIKHILGDNVVTNASGANLLNGIVSAIITSPPSDYGVFEVDEAALPRILHFVQNDDRKLIIVLLNLFRDQLDRYGEVDSIVKKWQDALRNFSGTLILNSDDPQIASLGNGKTIYFGLNDQKLFRKTQEHAMDSQFCPVCGQRLNYAGTFYSHLGHWSCPKCKFFRPKPLIDKAFVYPLPGLYNRYNTLAAVGVAHVLKRPVDLKNFEAAFGRQEEIGKAKIFLSKNPASFNESLRTVIELEAENILFSLNDRIPDGRDISWIWDVDFEMLPKKINLFSMGDRVYDLALRLKYAGRETKIVKEIPDIANLYILATYSAMLEIRKKLTGRKIL